MLYEYLRLLPAIISTSTIFSPNDVVEFSDSKAGYSYFQVNEPHLYISRIQPQMLIGSNFGLLATVNKKIVVKPPDWLYVTQVQPVAADVIRRSYTPN
jgi:hypothetical protein